MCVDVFEDTNTTEKKIVECWKLSSEYLYLNKFPDMG